MTMKSTAKNQKIPSKFGGLVKVQVAMLRYAFAIDRALIHLVFAALMIGLAIFTDKSHYLTGYLPLYHWGLLIGAGVQIFRSCKHSLTPGCLLLLVGFGGQILLHQHIPVYLPLLYLQGIAGAGVIGVIVAGFYRLK
ncbi:MAG: hypothetical protein NTV32_09455 [Gammaproteobacteria bacterium]|nr:hypothetical protein [Gammaproteobacteria bacterium]